MSSLELNKIAGAVLTAGVVATLSGFISHVVVSAPDAPVERAYAIALPEPDIAPDAGEPAPVEESVLMLLASADTASGEKVTRKCTACHSFDEGGANRVGPNLYDIVGRQIAAADGYAYSDVLAGLSAETWSYENLDAFLAAPKTWAPGTKMAYAGLKKSGDRADLIAYLRELSASPLPLPVPEAAVTEEPEVQEAATESANSPINDAVNVAAETAGDLGDAVTEAASEASDAVTDAAESALATASDAAETVSEVTSDAVEAVTEAASDAAETVSEATSDAVETATEAASDAAETITQAVSGGSGIATQIAAADPAAGTKVFRKCKACHTVESGGKHRIGPNLYDIVGRQVAGAEGYAYSDALKGKAGEVWDFDNLAAFLEKPKTWAPGTKMSFAGLRKPADVAALLAYLREQSDSPAALPQ